MPTPSLSVAILLCIMCTAQCSHTFEHCRYTTSLVACTGSGSSASELSSACKYIRNPSENVTLCALAVKPCSIYIQVAVNFDVRTVHM